MHIPPLPPPPPGEGNAAQWVLQAPRPPLDPPLPSHPRRQSLEAEVKASSVTPPGQRASRKSPSAHSFIFRGRQSTPGGRSVADGPSTQHPSRAQPSPPASVSPENANKLEHKPEQTAIRKVNPMQNKDNTFQNQIRIICRPSALAESSAEHSTPFA